MLGIPWFLGEWFFFGVGWFAGGGGVWNASVERKISFAYYLSGFMSIGVSKYCYLFYLKIMRLLSAKVRSKLINDYTNL